MTSKTIFTCNACGCEGVVTIKTYREHECEVCPSCGQALDIEHDSEDDEGWDE